MNSNTHNKKLINFYGSMVPRHKRVMIGLTYIYGLGYSRSRDICNYLNIDSHIKIGELKPEDINKIKSYIEFNDILVEVDLRRKESMYKQRLIDIGCYRGKKLHRRTYKVLKHNTKPKKK